MTTYLALGVLICFVSFACVGGYGVPQKCESGVIGPYCYGYGQGNCKAGYQCINRRCCRDTVCEFGIDIGSCNLLPGQQKCPFGYICFPNNFCCQNFSPPGPPPNICPMFTPPPPSVCKSKPRPPIACTCDKQCRGKCCQGPCGERFCL